MQLKAVVLLSGGLDSVVNFKKFLETDSVELILTFNYGQKAALREIESAEGIAEKYGIPHKTIDLDYLSDLDEGLTKGKFPKYDALKLDDLSYALETAKAVWVPNRNGIFINIAAAFADRFGYDSIVVGFNKEEGATFPDNTREYLERVNESLAYSTMNKTKVVCHTLDMDKKEIVGLGIKIQAPLEWVWSCYSGEDKMCGECESCRRLQRALKENHYLDEFTKTNRWGFK